jgi:hypothetical protein
MLIHLVAIQLSKRNPISRPRSKLQRDRREMREFTGKE